MSNYSSLSSDKDKSKEIHSNAMMSTNSKSANSDENLDDEEESKKKKKHKRGYVRYPELSNDFTAVEDFGYEPLNDAYLGNKNYASKQCPIIDAMADRCRGVDLLSGDINNELLSICGIHQICYLCVSININA